MIEAEVHQQLRAFLREQGETQWPHHLTMARLVARALRLGRSALLQVGPPSGYHGRHRLSYLMPALIWPGPVVLVAPHDIRQRLLTVEIPRLRQWIPECKAVRTGDRWPDPDFDGVLLTSPAAWLRDRLHQAGVFPVGIPTLIDGADDLTRWTQHQLTVNLQPCDWNELLLACPTQAELIRAARIQLTQALFQRPVNPYDCYLMDEPERETLQGLKHSLNSGEGSWVGLPGAWSEFWQRFGCTDYLLWATVVRQQGQFFLHCGPVEVASALVQVWPQQATVLIGGALDLAADATIYRQRVGLGELTCLKFSQDRQQELIQLYIPDGLPLPNTPQFQPLLLHALRTLLCISAAQPGLAVLLVGDLPLKTQVGSVLAAELGSRVQVEKTCLDENGVLVTGWEFWRQHQGVLPTPQLLVIATLPIPSLEHPLVAGRVAYYKRLRQDWFRLYLLPEALSELQRAIAPVRESQGVVALLDSRVLHRSYGTQVLTALSPYARINYLDPDLLEQTGHFP